MTYSDSPTPGTDESCLVAERGVVVLPRLTHFTGQVPVDLGENRRRKHTWGSQFDRIVTRSPQLSEYRNWFNIRKPAKKKKTKQNKKHQTLAYH